MGTYEKEYKVKWLNINPHEKKIEALYSIYANLDDERKVKVEDLIAVISDNDFDTLYNIEIMAFDNSSNGLDKIYPGQIKTYIFNGTTNLWESGTVGTYGQGDLPTIFNTSIGANGVNYNRGTGFGYAHNSKTRGCAFGDTALGNDDGVGVGYGANGANSSVAVGKQAVAGITYSVAVGYEADATTKAKQIALGGQDTTCTRYGEQKTASDSVNKYSRSTVTWYKSLAGGAGATEIFLDNSSERFTIQANSVMAFTVLVAARDNVANEGAGYKFEGVIKRDGSSNTALVGSVTKTVLAEEDATWDCDVVADAANNALKITVTGDGTNITQWVARAYVVETKF